MTASIERLPGSLRLPRPSPGRMKPLRAGIVNVWEYDNQEFWFSDGRLILRGHNTAGKSKALELLFPFVLDGDTRPHRLDPFGSVSKTMYWNLIGFAEAGDGGGGSSTRESAIGYCWAEFGRIDDDGVERYVTCIVGMRAVRSTGKRVDTWFAVTPARIGEDLDLAPSDLPLTADKFRAALPDHSVYSTSARDHRAATDHALFGLGPERYDALIHLLLQLRRPKLSEKLDMSRLGDYLSNALPPLEQHRMERLATAFSRLEEESAALERLDASARELHTFLDHYRAHARIQTRLRADEVRSANTQFDRVTEKARTERDKHDRATSLLSGIDTRLTELADAVVRINGQLAGLDLSKVHALEEVGKRATAAETHALSAEARASRDRSDADADKERSIRDHTAAAKASARRDDRLGAAADQSAAAGVDREHVLHASQLLDEPERAKVALRGVAGRREDLVLQVRASAGAADVAQRRILTDQGAYDDAESAVSSAGNALATAETELDGAVSDLVADVAAWSAEWAVPVPDGRIDALLAGERLTARALLVSARESVAAARSSVAGERALVAERRSSAVADRERVEAETDLAPPPRSGYPSVRPDGFTPLWACIDFEPSLSDAERAGLEAGLEASGVLGALVGPDGQVLDVETLDTLIVAADSPDRVPGLRPAGPDVDAAGRALAALGRAGSWSLDGRWKFGALTGRWSKDSAEYIGAAARAEARRRRIAELGATIAAADEELAQLDDSLAELDAESARLDAAEVAWPSTDRLLLARRERDRGVYLVADATAAAERAWQQLERSRTEGQAALDQLAAASAAAGCPAEAVDDVVSALARYREVLGEAVAAVQAAVAADQVAADAAARAADSEQRASESEASTSRDRAAALAARAEEEELRRTSGADAEAVLARQQELRSQLERSQEEQSGLGDQRDGALSDVAAAGALLEAAEGERIEREHVRAVALARLAALSSTELAVLAVGAVNSERDLSQVTAGLAFARSAYDRLRDVDIDQKAVDAVATRFHHAYTTLQSQLGVDFNPYLDASDGLEVCFGTLNGQTVMLSDLSASIDDQVRRRRETLTADERELIHRHLLVEMGSHLGDRVHDAWDLTRKMNEQLAAHPTRGGVSLELAWDVAPDAGSGAERAAKLLRREVRLLKEPERVALANFLHERVRAAREGAEGADMVDQLAGALDYRRWHRFSVYRVSAGRKERLTSRTQGVGSGGEQAKLAHLPLFAATSAYYASARADAPRLLMLDEAFAGIDDSQRGDCMGMLVGLDLDMVLTNYSEWGCYREIPSVATYHLERIPGRLGVAALRFVWDGNTRTEEDPWLADREAAPSGSGGNGLFA